MKTSCKETRKVSFVFIVVFFLYSAFFLFELSGKADTFYGAAPTGLVELTDYKYPVYLFVPPNYKPDRSFPLIVTVPGEGESPEKNIQFWTGLAKRRGLIVLAPTNIWPEELPHQKMDDWLMRIKEDVGHRYQIAPNRVYLVGKEGGAHYAAYLGVRYPNEFSAVALLGGSWVGKFEKLIRPENRIRKQRPFFIALKGDDEDLIKKTESIAYQFEKKGYPIYFIKLAENEEFSSDDFKKKLLEWLDKESQAWLKAIEESKRSVREKILIAIEEFFAL